MLLINIGINISSAGVVVVVLLCREEYKSIRHIDTGHPAIDQMRNYRSIETAAGHYCPLLHGQLNIAPDRNTFRIGLDTFTYKLFSFVSYVLIRL